MSSIAKVKEVAFGALDGVADNYITAALTEAAKHYGVTELGVIYDQVTALHAAHLLSQPGAPGGASARTVRAVSIGRGTASKTYAAGNGASDLGTTSYGQRVETLLAGLTVTPIALCE